MADVTPFLSQHPGGKKVVLKLAGKDATKEFKKFHEVNQVLQVCSSFPSVFPCIIFFFFFPHILSSFFPIFFPHISHFLSNFSLILLLLPFFPFPQSSEIRQSTPNRYSGRIKN